MTETQTVSHPLIRYLEELTQRGDRGALAALRRGLGQPPGAEPAMYPYVMPFIGDGTPPWEEQAYFTVAALYASHPASGATGNMGDHMARCHSEEDSALERRFVALLSAHPDDLALYLRQTISFLRSQEVPVNWHQLLIDVLAWGNPARYVQKNWARSFWGGRQVSEEEKKEN